MIYMLSIVIIEKFAGTKDNKSKKQ